MPKLGRHLTLSFLKPFRPSVTWAWRHDGRAAISSERKSCPSNGPQASDSRPAQSSGEQSAFERLRRRLRGKCVSAHIRVTRCFSQVLEASFHCVTFWNHAGLPALPSAAVRHSIADNRAATELLQVQHHRLFLQAAEYKQFICGDWSAGPYWWLQGLQMSGLFLFWVQFPQLRFYFVYRGGKLKPSCYPATAVKKNGREETVLSPTSCSSHIICFRITPHCAVLVPCNACVSVYIHTSLCAACLTTSRDEQHFRLSGLFLCFCCDFWGIVWGR